MRPAPVSVRVPFVQTSAASVPNPVSVLVPAAQTLVGMFVIEEAIDVSETPSEVEAVLVLAFTSATTDELALVTSDKVAKEPEVSPAPVRVRAPDDHTSVASVPNPVRVRVPAAQTLVGTNDTADETEAIAVPIEVEAMLVFAFTSATTDDEAFVTSRSVFAFTSATTDEEAESTSDKVAREPEVRPAPVSVRVP